MKLRDLISVTEETKAKNGAAETKAESAVNEYMLSQTVIVKELYDIVRMEYNSTRSSSGQISPWQILNIAKQAILKQEVGELT